MSVCLNIKFEEKAFGFHANVRGKYGQWIWIKCNEWHFFSSSVDTLTILINGGRGLYNFLTRIKSMKKKEKEKS